MDSDRLILGMAGNVPYYAPEEYLNPSWTKRLKRLLIDYRTAEFNNPMGKGAHFLFRGLAACKEQDVTALELRMWGSIDPRYKTEAQKSGIAELVQIDGFVSKEESMARLDKCDVMVLTLALGANGNPPFSLPGKMFDYFAIGRPILSLVEESYCTEVLRESGLGVVVDPKDPQAIAEALKDLSQNKATLSEKYQLKEGFLDRFGHGRMVDEMADIFDSLG